MVSDFVSITGNIIASFPLESVTTKEFGWLHPRSWSQQDGNYWQNHRYSQVDSLIHRPPYVLEKNKKIKFSVGTWVLKVGDEQSAWAEIHCFHSGFDKTFLFFDCSTTIDFRCLSFLISAAFISTESDLMIVAPRSSQAWSIIPKDLPGDQSKWTIVNTFADEIPELRTTSVLSISRADWWLREQSRADKEALAYLVKRKQFDKKQAQRSAQENNRPRSRGLLGLFNIWRR
jgi:hypothetical protein